MEKSRKVLVTGACGQLGSELRRLTAGSSGFLFSDYAGSGEIMTLDICDRDATAGCIRDNNIGVVINCAAYTNVEKAEEDFKACYRINCEGTRSLADAALESDSALIHISTDYVFDGSKGEPYLETDTPSPLSVYGRSKAISESIITDSGVRGIIIRTAWLYSPYGKNFVKTMLALGASRDTVTVVNDQVGSPTYAEDLARAILQLLPCAGSRKAEIYNYSNEGACSWYDFASEIMAQAGLPCKVTPVSSSGYPQKALRPGYSYLDKGKITSELHMEVPEWQYSLKKCLERLI